jgi:hypothetical protein
MRTRKSVSAILACVPLALAVSCGGGGGGGGEGVISTPTGSDQTGDSLPASTSAAITSVPLAGTMVADCADTGVGIADDAVDAVNGITAGSLPASLPKLSEVIAQADLASLPLLGGVAEDGLGQLQALSADDVKALLPLGAAGLADVPVPSQLPAACAELTAVMPAGITGDPAALLDLLGDPTHALGVIALLDGGNDPVGALLVTVPAGLVAGSGFALPGAATMPVLTALAPLDASTPPLVGGSLTDIVSSVLGLLDTNGLLAGTPLGDVAAGLVP